MKRVLIVRLDAIGDWILFRNVLAFIRNSPPYRDAHLAVFGNPAWKSLAEAYDANSADEWIWASDRNRLFRLSRENLLPACIWKKRVLAAQAVEKLRLKSGNFDEVLSLQAFRDPILDWFCEGLAPKVIHGYELDDGEMPFVFMRNRRIASRLTGSECRVPLSIGPLNVLRRNEVMLFAGASHWTRMWPHYDELASRIESQLGAKARILGRHNDKRSSMAELVEDVAGARAVVSNDTMMLHLAASLGVPTVAISNGVSGKDDFWPYPESLGKKVKVIIPKTHKSTFNGVLGLAINQLCMYRALSSIRVESVMTELRSVLSLWPSEEDGEDVLYNMTECG